MLDATAITAEDWLRAAERERRDAEILARSGGSPEGVYYHAGFAVECALKALIMQREEWHQWPTRRQATKLYSHDLSRLAERAGLRRLLADEAGRSSGLAIAWQTVAGWRPEHRYSGAPMPARVAHDMLRFATNPDDGILAWLLGLYRNP